MSTHTRLVDERDLIAELRRSGPRDRGRLRMLCRVLFDSEDLADHPDLVSTAAIARDVYMSDPLPGPEMLAARVHRYLDDLTHVSADIHGGPPRMLVLPSGSD